MCTAIIGQANLSGYTVEKANLRGVDLTDLRMEEMARVYLAALSLEGLGTIAKAHPARV